MNHSHNIRDAVKIRERNERAFDVYQKANTLGITVDPSTGEERREKRVFGLTPEEAHKAAVIANTLNEKKFYSNLDKGADDDIDERRIKALAAAKAVKAAKDSGHATAGGKRKRRKTRKTKRKTRGRRKH